MKFDRIAGIVVRRARRADVPRLAALYHQLPLDSYSETEVPPARMLRAFDALAADRRHTILLAEQGAELIGTAHVIVVAHLGHGLAPMAIVENVVVDEAARSRGVGELLMRRAAAIAHQAKCYKLCLNDPYPAIASASLLRAPGMAPDTLRLFARPDKRRAAASAQREMKCD